MMTMKQRLRAIVGDDDAYLPSSTEARRSGRVSARVYRTIRQQILEGELPAGMHLSQQALSQKLHTSNGPVISALKHLVHDGLVTYQASHGYRVSEWDEAKLNDMLIVRRALETEAARLAARRAAPEDLDELRAIVRQMGEAVRQDQHAQGDVLNAEFHLAVARLSRSPGLIEAVNRCHVMEIGRRRLKQYQRFGDFKNLAPDHELLVEAIASGDPDRAGQAMHRHLSPKQLLHGRNGDAWSLPRE
jgi:DNA-binding GntR family transcriptional regulator